MAYIQELNTNKAPKIKGSVTIMLNDARTGEVEQVIKGENLVTNALSILFASNYFGANNYKNLFPIIKKVFGGVLCFRDSITANAANIYPPTNYNNPVIAHAGQTNYSQTTDDLTRGTPNNAEAGEITNGYRLVFDFVSTQGNGTFNTLSLTHKDTGDFWLFNGTKFKPCETFTPLNSDLTDPENAPQFFDTENNTAYQVVPNDSTTLTIWEIKDMSPLTSIGLVQPLPTATREASLTQISHDVTLPRNTRQYYYYFKQSAQELHALYCNGNSIEKSVIDLTDFSISTTTLTVPGADLGRVDASMVVYNVPTIYPDKNGFIYIRKADNTKIYQINYNNPSEVYDITATPVNAEQQGRCSFISCGNMGVNPWGGLIISGGEAFQCASASQNDYDFNYQWNRWSHVRANEIDGNQLVWWSPRAQTYSDDSQIGNIFSKLYLGTIFNLPNPITKTSSQTMKIIYELTKATT